MKKNQNPIRLIARIDVRNGYHIKTINGEGVKKLRTIEESLERFTKGVNEHDEILLIDAVSSLYGFDNWLIRQDNKHMYCPIPFSIGGGVASVDMAISTLEKGADKIVVNTAAIAKPKLLSDISNICGRQAVVLQIDTRKINNIYRCFINGSRELSNLTVENWLQQAQDNGVGEIHVTCINSEGVDATFPDDLADLCRSNTQLPLIVSGGIRSALDMKNLRLKFEINAFSFSSITNHLGLTVEQIRRDLLTLGESVRCPH